ncbi:MAG: FAD-dependent monooxygenase, partial [Planctomycetota bacterium]|nr:FAD-dependent monooxygenase [Planctomycetota bacterium]
ERRETTRAESASAMPASLAAIVAATSSLSVQAIFGGSTHRRVVDRLVLVGDAACLAIPHVGAGTSLAISDARRLAEAIEGDLGTLDRRLERWDEARRTATGEVMDVGRELGRFLQLSGTGWTLWTESDFDGWWTRLRGDRRMYFESS